MVDLLGGSAVHSDFCFDLDNPDPFLLLILMHWSLCASVGKLKCNESLFVFAICSVIMDVRQPRSFSFAQRNDVVLGFQGWGILCSPSFGVLQE